MNFAKYGCAEGNEKFFLENGGMKGVDGVGGGTFEMRSN